MLNSKTLQLVKGTTTVNGTQTHWNRTPPAKKVENELGKTSTNNAKGQTSRN